MTRLKFIQLSDIHLVAGGRELFGSSPRQRLRAAIDSIGRDHADAAFCLLTGDLADAGDAAAYAELAREMARLPMPVWPLVGNHDDRSALRAVFPGLGGEAEFLQYAVATPAGRFLMLDTLDAGRGSGFYCCDRQSWLRERMTETGEEPIWLVMHHPPFPVGIPSMDRYALRNAEDFWAIIAPHRQRIRHIFFGHLHRAIGGSWRGIPVSCPRSPNHQVALDLVVAPENGDVPGCQEAPGYSVVLADDDRVIVHHHDFAYAGERFWI